MANYKVYVRDSNFNKVAEIEDYQSLQMITRFNAVGSWALDLPTDCDAARELIKPKSGIIVTRNGRTLFSGPATARKRSWDNSGDKLNVSGYDDMVWLKRSIAYPVINGPFTDNAYDVRTGAAETIMKQYVDANIGTTARQDRKVPGLLIAADTGIGSTVTGRARFDNLLDLLCSLALAGGDLGFRVIQSSTSLSFEVYQPADKTSTVIFSPLLGNLLNFEYTSEDPTANFVIVGGGGEGTARTLMERGDSSSVTEFGRIESFVDRRDTTDTAELNQAIDEELSQKAENTSLSISPIDSDNTAFGSDYSLGDKVSVVLTQPNEVIEIETLYYFLSSTQITPIDVERIQKIQEKLDVIKDVVREVIITLNSYGETIVPTIGTPDSLSHSMLKIYDKMTKIQKRISNLERR
jgi:hypothetical protein